MKLKTYLAFRPMEGFTDQWFIFVCSDDNECANHNGGCAHECVNIEGGHFCRCNEGYRLHVDEKTCIRKLDDLCWCVQRSCFRISEIFWTARIHYILT